MKCALVVAVVLVCAGAAEAAERSWWLRDRLLAEWIVGMGGWRTAVGLDPKVPGFDAVGGGSELCLGLEVIGGLGLFASGRVIAGERGGDLYIEGLGGLGLQVRASDRVRLRAGAAAGRATLRDDAAALVGGFAAVSIDLVSLGAGGRLSTALSLRLDVDGLVGAHALLPDSSLALALGLGVRY